MTDERFSILHRCLKLYDPKFVTFWNAKRMYQRFYNDIGLSILKVEKELERA